MIGHTRAPWRHEDGVIYGFEDGEEVVIAYATQDPSDGLTEFDLQNIPRIVACVNACEGIETSALETWGVGGCLDAQNILGATNRDLGLRNVELGHGVQALLRERDAMRGLLARLVAWNNDTNGNGIELGEMLVDAEALIEHGPAAIEHKELVEQNEALKAQVMSLSEQLDVRAEEFQRAALQNMARPGDVANLVFQRDGLLRQLDEVLTIVEGSLGQFNDEALLMSADLANVPAAWLLEFRAEVRHFNARWHRPIKT